MVRTGENGGLVTTRLEVHEKALTRPFYLSAPYHCGIPIEMLCDAGSCAVLGHAFSSEVPDISVGNNPENSPGRVAVVHETRGIAEQRVLDDPPVPPRQPPVDATRESRE